MAKGKKSDPEVPVAESPDFVETAAPAARGDDVIVMAFDGDAGTMGRLWSRYFQGEFSLRVTSPEVSLQAILADIVADDGVADTFTLLPPDIFPCGPTRPEDLKAPYVYVNGKGARQYANPVPMTFEKSNLVELLATDPGGEMDDDTFLKEYVSRYRGRPVEVGFTFGNFVTPVLRGNPCEHVVLEAFVRKKFVSASHQGFRAIGPLIEGLLLR